MLLLLILFAFDSPQYPRRPGRVRVGRVREDAPRGQDGVALRGPRRVAPHLVVGAAVQLERCQRAGRARSGGHLDVVAAATALLPQLLRGRRVDLRKTPNKTIVISVWQSPFFFLLHLTSSNYDKTGKAAAAVTNFAFKDGRWNRESEPKAERKVFCRWSIITGRRSPWNKTLCGDLQIGNGRWASRDRRWRENLSSNGNGAGPWQNHLPSQGRTVSSAGWSVV